jgi:hypothetical protein
MSVGSYPGVSTDIHSPSTLLFPETAKEKGAFFSESASEKKFDLFPPVCYIKYQGFTGY